MSILCFLTFACSSIGQKKQDTITRYTPNQFQRYQLGLDNRYSIIGDNIINVFGVKAGYAIHDRWRVGVGYYQLLSPAAITFDMKNQEYQARFSFWYASAFVEGVLIHRKRYEISIPLIFAVGERPYIKTTNCPYLLNPAEKTVQLLEISLTGYYKILNWMGPGIGIGYRYMLNQNEFLQSNFNAPVFIARIQIFLDPLYVDLFPDGISRKKKKKN
ncbi:MAG: hypothetical protein ACHQRM_14210 [Bacteroidia bacterium]